jgi:hypothetical protein
MSEQADHLLAGTVFLTAGAHLAEPLSRGLIKAVGLKPHSWFKGKLGYSALDRGFFSTGTPSGLRKSNIELRGAGVLFVVVGLQFPGLGLLRYFHIVLS